MSSILVIDDSPSVLAFVSQALSEAGYGVITADNGKTGVERLRHQPVEMILTDMCMPEEDGLEVLRDARKIRPDTGIIVMSSKQGSLNMFNAAKALGALAALQKPFNREQLLRQVAACLRAAAKPVMQGTAN